MKTNSPHENYPHTQKSMLKQKKTVTTQQKELSTFREAFEDQKNECESKMNKRHQ